MSPVVAFDTHMEMLRSMANDRCPILGTRQPEARAAAWALEEIVRLRATATYAVTLDDLALFAAAGTELDALKNYVDLDQPEETYRIHAIVERMHRAIERAAGADGVKIYAPGDGSELAALESSNGA